MYGRIDAYHCHVQKRKANSGQDLAASEHEDTSKPTAVFKPTKGRTHTVSIALPGSIIAKYATFSLFPIGGCT